MRIATLAGIPLRLHWSFIGLVLAYVAWTVRFDGWLAGAQVTAIGFALFASVVLHELGHALAARRYGIATAHITLYPFGGVAAITRPPRNPGEELVIALAGPAVNVLLAGLALGAWAVFGGLPLLVIVVLNVMMGVFNLLPAYPMDGGRVLRALLALRLGHERASALSIRVGSGFAWVFIAIGLATFSPGLALIGGFLLLALRGERRRLAWVAEQRIAAELLRYRPYVPPAR